MIKYDYLLNTFLYFPCLEYQKTNPGEVCTDDDLVIRSEKECRDALEKLGYQVSEVWNGTSISIPYGCSINNKMALHFNWIPFHGTGTGRQDLTAICRRTSNKGKVNIKKLFIDLYKRKK